MDLWRCPDRSRRVRRILAAQAIGADFAYIGTAFIATHEARAVEGYKDMIVASASKDIVYSSLFTGVHGNYLAAVDREGGHGPEQPARWRQGHDRASSRAKARRQKRGRTCGAPARASAR